MDKRLEPSRVYFVYVALSLFPTMLKEGLEALNYFIIIKINIYGTKSLPS